MRKTLVPQHVLIDRVQRSLNGSGAAMRYRNINKRCQNDPGDILILRPSPHRGVPRVNLWEPNREISPYPGTLEDLARDLGVMGDHEQLAPC